MRMVSAKATAFLPGPAGDSPVTRVLDTAARASGITRVTPKTALHAGSSQQGKPRRAAVASNWVAAIGRAAPAAAFYILPYKPSSRPLLIPRKSDVSPI